jgi:hypothetical protein
MSPQAVMQSFSEADAQATQFVAVRRNRHASASTQFRSRRAGDPRSRHFRGGRASDAIRRGPNARPQSKGRPCISST